MTRQIRRLTALVALICYLCLTLADVEKLFAISDTLAKGSHKTIFVSDGDHLDVILAHIPGKVFHHAHNVNHHHYHAGEKENHPGHFFHLSSHPDQLSGLEQAALRMPSSNLFAIWHISINAPRTLAYAFQNSIQLLAHPPPPLLSCLKHFKTVVLTI